MLTQEQNERLPRVGQGTPMGGLLRRYWYPIGLEKIQGEPALLMRGEKLQELVAEATKSFKEQLPRYNEIRQQVYAWLSR